MVLWMYRGRMQYDSEYIATATNHEFRSEFWFAKDTHTCCEFVGKGDCDTSREHCTRISWNNLSNNKLVSENWITTAFFMMTYSQIIWSGNVTLWKIHFFGKLGNCFQTTWTPIKLTEHMKIAYRFQKCVTIQGHWLTHGTQTRQGKLQTFSNNCIWFMLTNWINIQIRERKQSR